MKFFFWLDKCRPSSSNLIGWRFFQIGLFLLPASAFLSGLFLIPALFCVTPCRSQSYFKDPWNYPFFLAGLFMVIGACRAYSGWLAWVGLLNWLPLFWLFWRFQFYLSTSLARRRSALWLLSGTVPVVVTGFGQLWLGWEGPWQLFDGLIIWFVDPGGEPLGRLSGLFDYANIAGAWLAIVWPFSLAASLQKTLLLYRRIFALSLSSAIVAALILTDSRNAWGGLILTIPFVVGPSRWIWLLPLLIFILMPISLAVLPGVGSQVQEWARKVVPENLWSRLNDMRYTDQRLLATTRLGQWDQAVKFVLERPWFGWGAAAFTILYPLRTGHWHGHAHNLPLEISISHGFPVALLIVGTIIALLIKALRVGALNDSRVSKESNNILFDRAWWTSSFILLVLHGADMPFFDSRLNVVGWILLAGLRSFIKYPEKIKIDLDVEPISPF